MFDDIHRLARNRSCHLRDRDIFFRSAMNLFSSVNSGMDRRLRSPESKQKLQLRIQAVLDSLETAIFHGSLATKGMQMDADEDDNLLEEEVILDFLRTFSTAVNHIKFLVQHSLLLHNLSIENEHAAPQMRKYMETMRTLDEETVLKLMEQIKTRLMLCNRTMKIK